MAEAAQFLWLGELSLMEQLCLKSFVDHGYDVHLYAYGDALGVPEGVIVKDASEILGPEYIFKYDKEGFAYGTYACFADQFRYHLLYQKGGWWFDMDFVALKRLSAPKDILFASTWEGQWGECALNCAMWCAPGDDRMKWLRDECDSVVKKSDMIHGETGPFLIQRLVRDKNLQNNVAPWWKFCPIPWRMIKRTAYRRNLEWGIDKLRLARQVWRERTRADFRAGYIRQGTAAVHLHNEFWKHAGMDKDIVYHPWSLVGKLQRRHGLTSSSKRPRAAQDRGYSPRAHRPDGRP
jgi:hypothetical protein